MCHIDIVRPTSKRVFLQYKTAQTTLSQQDIEKKLQKNSIKALAVLKELITFVR